MGLLLALQDAVVNGEASGAVIAANAQPITGSPSGAAGALGSTLTANAQFTAGASTGGAVALGQDNALLSTGTDKLLLADGSSELLLASSASSVVSATVSVIAGAASGGASVSAQVLTATGSLVSGVVSGDAVPFVTVDNILLSNGADDLLLASGFDFLTLSQGVITTAASLISGSGETETSGEASGSTVAANVEPIGGSPSGAAESVGTTLAASASLTSGQISGSAEITTYLRSPSGWVLGVDGTSFIHGVEDVTSVASTSIIDGAASGAAVSGAELLSAASAVLDGTATADASASGDLLSAFAALIVEGEAQDGTAEGATVEATASLIPGAVSVETTITVGGRTSYIDTTTRKDALAKGQRLRVNATILPGFARGTAVALGEIVFVGIAVEAGLPSAAATTVSNNLVYLLPRIIPGSAGVSYDLTDEEQALLVMAEAA